MPRHIAIADPSPLRLAGISAWLNRLPDVKIVGQTTDCNALINLAEIEDLDLIIVDFAGSPRGVQQVKDVLAAAPNVRILVQSSTEDVASAEHFVRAGALGYLTPTADFEMAQRAIERVLANKLFLSPEVSEHVLSNVLHNGNSVKSAPYSELTDRQLEIFRLVGKGKDTKTIADDLWLSVKTIDAHKGHIRKKLGFESSHELYVSAVKWIEASGTREPLKSSTAPVLLVDDNRVDTMMAQRALNHLKLENRLITAKNGEDALEKLETLDELPCIMLVDIRMPKMNGLEFLTVVKQHERLRTVPVIIYSISEKASDRDAAFAKGAAGYMIKPKNFPSAIELFRKVSLYWSSSKFATMN